MDYKFILTAIFLFIHDFSYSQNTVCFTIEDNPDINSPAFSDFTKYVQIGRAHV